MFHPDLYGIGFDVIHIDFSVLSVLTDLEICFSKEKELLISIILFWESFHGFVFYCSFSIQ